VESIESALTDASTAMPHSRPAVSTVLPPQPPAIRIAAVLEERSVSIVAISPSPADETTEMEDAPAEGGLRWRTWTGGGPRALGAVAVGAGVVATRDANNALEHLLGDPADTGARRRYESSRNKAYGLYAGAGAVAAAGLGLILWDLVQERDPTVRTGPP